MLKNLEHRLLKNLKKYSMKGESFFIACSGGRDSMIALRSFYELRPVLNLNLFVIYVFHGKSKNKKENEYRQKSFYFVKNECEKRKIAFLSNGIKEEACLRDEASLRDFRYFHLTSLMKKEKTSSRKYLVLAHHFMDLLETRMIRLIRGVGPLGLKSMQVLKDSTFRPFLEEKEELLNSYVKQRGICFISDPSNKNLDPLRNWIRYKWFFDLEKKRKGSLFSLARSLELLNESFEDQKTIDQTLDRSYFSSLKKKEKNSLIASYLKTRGSKDYSQSQIEEIVKNLTTSDKKRSFKASSLIWELNEDQILTKNLK